MNWGRLFVGAAVAATLSAPALAAPLFPDVPDNHWATDAVKTLAAKGIIEGYPDGTFKGDRASTRWELAMIIARLLAKMEQSHATFATKAELDEVQRLTDALRQELDSLGVRVNKLEEHVAKLDERVSSMERIRFYGRLHALGVSNNVKGDVAGIGTIGNNAIDWNTGRLLINGDGYTLMGLLGLNLDITDEISAGAEFVSFTSAGNAGVDEYWGLSAPWNCNIWTGRNSLDPLAQSDNNFPFTRMVLDNFWVMHAPSETKFTAGSYYTKYLGGYVFNGARNPNVNRPHWLPFYGLDINGSIAGVDSGFKYEAFYNIDPDASLYDTHSYGGTLHYDFPAQRGTVALHMVKHRNQTNSDGFLVGNNLVPLPTVGWLGPNVPVVPTSSWLGIGNTAQSFVGPQEEVTFGVDAAFTLEEAHKIVLEAQYATSNYNPDTSKTAFDTTADGNMFAVGVSGQPLDGLSLSLRYQSVDPTYDPFMVQYPVTNGIPVFLPYGGYYSNYYQMHDYVSLPNNRQGFKFAGEYSFNEEATKVYAYFDRFTQVKATTPGQVQTVGNIEPIFTMLAGGGAEKGDITSFSLGGSHRFDCGLTTGLSYTNYNISRDALAIDDISLKQNVYRIDLGYPITDSLAVRGSYQYIDYSGHTGIVNMDFNQSTPAIGFDYNFTEDTKLSLDYRFIDFKQKAFTGGDYQCNQLMMEMRTDF